MRFLYDNLRAKKLQPTKMLVILQDADDTVSYLNLGFTIDTASDATGKVINCLLRSKFIDDETLLEQKEDSYEPGI
jgi:hypothetical protein